MDGVEVVKSKNRVRIFSRDHAFTFAQIPSLGQIVMHTGHSSRGTEEKPILTWGQILEP